MRRKDPLLITAFHRAALKTILGFLVQRNVRTVSDLNAVNGKKLLEEPLWKLVEANGKYGGPFISEGVKAIEDKVGRVGASSGTWAEAELRRAFGPPTDGHAWGKLPSHCCHIEHVAERARLVEMLLREPDRVDEIVDSAVVGCVILRTEHPRLRSLPVDLSKPWRRYEDAGIRVWSRDELTWVA